MKNLSQWIVSINCDRFFIHSNEQGQTKTFLVTRVDEKSVTIDGNNPLCGREVIFKLEILCVREATEEEIEAGGPVDAEPDIQDIVGKNQPVKPIH